MPHTTAVVGRQPIVGRSGELIGYELLFRPLPTSQSATDPAAPHQLSGDEMTNDVIFNALGLGIDRLTGGATLFCNADRGVLTGQIPVSLPPKQTVIEVLETVELDDEVLAGCRALSRAGYRLAADDFIWVAGAEELLEIVDIVKVDLRATPLPEVPALMEQCRAFEVQLLAEKIETAAELKACQDLNFDMFQGYYVGRPSTVTGKALGTSRIATMKLASMVFDDNANFDSLDAILRNEPTLSYQLIQLATIGRFGELKREIRSTREALVWIGLGKLRGWIPALLLRPAGRAVDTNLPTVLGRARLAELLAASLYPRHTDLAFTAGMLSAFDLLLGVPRENLPLILDIPPELQRAVFGSDTPIGRLIGDIIDYEQYGLAAACFAGIDRAGISQSAAQAFSWAMRATEMVDHFTAA
ncbi:MAG: EAL domain-containing protein [Nakamurella sp.]